MNIFSPQHFYEVNREEQFYCSLFTHALLSSNAIRKRFLKQIELDSRTNDLEVYVEAAPLRDYWNELGDPKKYSQKTHKARESVLKELLSYFNISNANLSNSLFWTKKPDDSKSKYCNPGSWKTESLLSSSLGDLLILKYVFNSKPDIMIVSHSHLILIEAKLESKETTYGPQKIPQTEIQKKIGEIIIKSIPTFTNKIFKHCTLKIKGADITWKNIHDWVLSEEIDSFTKKSFKSLIARYSPT